MLYTPSRPIASISRNNICGSMHHWNTHRHIAPITPRKPHPHLQKSLCLRLPQILRDQPELIQHRLQLLHNLLCNHIRFR